MIYSRECYRNPHSHLKEHNYKYVGSRQAVFNYDLNILSYLDFVCQYCGDLNSVTQIASADQSISVTVD